MTPNQLTVCKSILESAAYGGSNYWAEVSKKGDKYTFKEVEEPFRQKEITAEDILKAATIAAGSNIKLAREYKAECALLHFDYDNCDFDSIGADVVVQVAVLGDVIYG